MTPTPTQSQIQTALVNFLTAVLPAGVPIVAGQNNRVPPPAANNYVVMTPIRRFRLATNIDTTQDVKFTASIAGVVMTVMAVAFGTIAMGSTISGTGVAASTTINEQISGTPGGIGTYQLSGAAQTVGLESMAAGQLSLMQETEITFQLDFHSQNVLDSADMAQIVSTAFRDEYAVDQFASQPNGGYGVVPLYADDPKQVPFINDSNQYETRWMLEAKVQCNQTIVVPLFYADVVNLTVKDVTALFPA